MSAASRIPSPRRPMDDLVASTPVTSVPRQRRSRGRNLQPAPPLGSLTQREHRTATVCGACGSQHLTHLSMSLTDGTPVDFVSCHRCEHRAWAHAGTELPVDAILDRTRKG